MDHNSIIPSGDKHLETKEEKPQQITSMDKDVHKHKESFSPEELVHYKSNITRQNKVYGAADAEALAEVQTRTR